MVFFHLRYTTMLLVKMNLKGLPIIVIASCSTLPSGRMRHKLYNGTCQASESVLVLGVVVVVVFREMIEVMTIDVLKFSIFPFWVCDIVSHWHFPLFFRAASPAYSRSIRYGSCYAIRRQLIPSLIAYQVSLPNGMLGNWTRWSFLRHRLHQNCPCYP